MRSMTDIWNGLENAVAQSHSPNGFMAARNTAFSCSSADLFNGCKPPSVMLHGSPLVMPQKEPATKMVPSLSRPMASMPSSPLLVPAMVLVQVPFLSSQARKKSMPNVESSLEKPITSPWKSMVCSNMPPMIMLRWRGEPCLGCVVTRTTGTGQPTAFVVLGGVVDGWGLFHRGLGVPLNRGKWKHEEHAGGQEGEKRLETHRFTIGLSHKNPSCSRFVGSLH